jgi:cation diffusion facilitator CzcD-associated flavoprotein CzcO
VLIVGAGNSGFDIANHLAKVDLADCWFSVRTGSSVLPKRLFGVAVHKFSPWLARLPTSVVDIAISLTERMAFGDLTKLGFPRSSHKAATRLARDHVAIPVDDGAIKALREGRIKVVQEVVEFTQAGTVLHKNGVVTAPEVIIYATGYGAHHQSFLGELANEDGRVLAPGGHDIPGLWFIGMTPGLISYFHNARNEAVAIAAAMRSRLDTDARSGR